jgi:hypothetical protein
MRLVRRAKRGRKHKELTRVEKNFNLGFSMLLEDVTKPYNFHLSLYEFNAIESDGYTYVVEMSLADMEKLADKLKHAIASAKDIIENGEIKGHKEYS